MPSAAARRRGCRTADRRPIGVGDAVPAGEAGIRVGSTFFLSRSGRDLVDLQFDPWAPGRTGARRRGGRRPRGWALLRENAALRCADLGRTRRGGTVNSSAIEPSSRLQRRPRRRGSLTAERDAGAVEGAGEDEDVSPGADWSRRSGAKRNGALTDAGAEQARGRGAATARARRRAARGRGRAIT